MRNQNPAPAVTASQRLQGRSITGAVGRSHNTNTACISTFMSLIATATLTILLSACASDPSSVASVASETEAINVPDQPQSDEMVDCRLPSQVRQLGTQMTYVTERHSIRTTKEDCTIRGGEQVLGKQSD